MNPSPPSPTKKKRRPIHISNDVWWNVFEWLFRAELGLKMALVSPRFDAIVDKFNAQKCWSIGILETKLAADQANGEICCFANDKKFLGKFPIAETPPPKGLKEFKSISLSYFDSTVLQFIRNLRTLFVKNGINLVLSVCNYTCGRTPKWWPISSPEVWPLLAQNVVRLAILDDYDFCSPIERLPVDFLCQCVNLYLMDSRDIFPDSSPVNAVSSSPISSAHALWQWLHSPRGDGRPKILLCQEIWSFADKIRELKTAFCDASAPVSFIIRLSLSSFAGEQFELRNDRTGEMLSMEMVATEDDKNEDGEGQQLQQMEEEDNDNDDILTHYIKPERNLWLLKRRPTVGGGKWQKQWAQWEAEAIGWNWTNAWNVIEVANEEDVDVIEDGNEHLDMDEVTYEGEAMDEIDEMDGTDG